MGTTQGLGVLVVIATLVYSGNAQVNPACLRRLDLAIVFDSSGSVNFNNFYNWQNAKQITYSFLRNFTIGPGAVHVALMQFSNNASVVFDCNQGQSRAFVEREIQNLQNMQGGTNIAAALELARLRIFTPQGGDRENVQNVLVLITDGQPTIRIPDTLVQAQLLKRNVMIITVAISGRVDQNLLRQIGSSVDQPIVTFDHIYITQNFLRSQFLDLCILMDSSGSILFLNIHNWYYAKLFLQYLVDSLMINERRTRVAAITFNETATLRFNLNEHNRLSSVVGAVRAIEYSGGRTNLAAAMRLARQRVFNQPPRPNTKRVALLITDGMPTDEPGRVETEANLLKRSGVDIISVVVQGRAQVDRQRLIRLASIISSDGINLKPAIMEVTDYRALGSRVNSVVDRICSIPIGRTPRDDLRVECYRNCRERNPVDQNEGNFHFCPTGVMTRDSDCIYYIYCDPFARMLMLRCPPGTMFDDSIKACTWKTCSCPGNTRRCLRP